MPKAIGTSLLTILLDDRFAPGRTGVGAGGSLNQAILALAPVLVAFLVQLMMWPIIQPFAWFLFSPAVFLSAWIGGRRLGIFASVVATLLVWYFFLPPERSFVFERTSREVMAALTFLGTGVVFSLFHDRLKRANRRVAEALAASRYQAQLESVFQAIQDGIVVTDMEGSFLLVNEAEARRNGFPSAEAMKRDITFYQDLYDLSYPDGKPLPFEEWPINKVLKGGSITNLELRARRRDTGQEWFVSFSGEPVRDEEGKQILAVVGTRDITERKRAEESLRASESRFRATFENAAVGIAHVAPDGRFLEINQRLCDIVGYTREELLAKTFADITHPDYLEADLGELRRMLAGEIEVYLREKRYRRKDGSFVWAGLAVSLVRDADGSPKYFVAVIKDVSARKQAEENLRRSESRFRATFENAAVGIAHVAPDGRFLEVNQRLCDIVGYRPEELIAKTFGDITHPDDSEADWERARLLLAGGIDTYSIEKRYYRKDGAIVWGNMTASLVRKADGAPDYLIKVVEDISARKQVEENLRESQQTLRLFIEHAPAALAMFDREMRYLAVSRRWMADYGLGDEDIIGRSHYDVFRPMPEHWREAHRRGLRGEVVRTDEDRFVRANGAVQWLRWEVRPWYAANGAIGGIVIFAEDITEQKRTMEALRASELRFRTMVSAIPSLTFESDPDGNNTFVSDQWRAYTGMTAEETAGISFAKVIHPDDAEDVKARWFAAMRSGLPFESRHRLRAADGSYRWFLGRALPGRDAEGRVVRWAGSLTDIDDLMRAEEALRESESRFRQLAESLPQLVWTCRADGWCDYLSPQWVAYTGVPEAEQLGFGWLRQLHPDDREPTLAAWNRAVANGAPMAVENRIRRNDGEYRWFKAWVSALRDSSGKVIKWFGSDTDIDDQKRAEQSLRESKERLAGIVSSAMDAIITVDEDQRVVLFNEAAERMFGCPASEAMGQTLDRFIPERFRAARAGHIRRLGETGGAGFATARLGELSALRADGSEFPIEASISSVEIGGRKLYTVIHRDITQRKQAEAEREQLAQEQVARAAAEAANRSKDEFLAMVSHELRSPLNAILGYARLLRSGQADSREINKATAIIERNAKAQLQIIEDLLDSARIITGKLRIEPVPVDLVPVLEAALDTVRPAAEAKGVTLIADFSLSPEETSGDPTRLQQIVWNLLTNAVKFTPEGGRVTLRMESSADHICVTVSDTGKGIEPEFLPFIFDRFRQADTTSARRFGGLGLGLSLVKNLVESHGGTITAASEGEGRGSTFTVTLPRRQPNFVPPPPAVTPGEALTEGSIALDEALSLEGVSLLVVDDQEDARVALSQTLSMFGAQVMTASSGAEALALLSAPPSGKRPDVLILDIAMPGEDGYAVLKKARALEAEQGVEEQIPAVALTAFGRREDRLRALQAGFFMHITKPVEPAELAVTIASLTKRRAWERGQKE